MTLLSSLVLILLAAADGTTSVAPAEPTTNSSFFPPTFWPGLCATLIYGLVGIALVVLGFKVFDWLTPQIHVERELAEKQNVAVAILCAAVILGICYIVAQISH
jgi:putative membrane protein